MLTARWFAVVSIAGMSAVSSFAQVEEVRLRIDGVTCPLCVINVEKSVQKLQGVDTAARIESFLDKGLTVVPWSAFQKFDPAPVRSVVKKSGFTLRAIDLTATGVLPATPSVSGALIDVSAPGTGEVFHVIAAERADHQQSWRELLAYVMDPTNDRSVRIDGAVIADSDAVDADGWKLAMTGWSPAKFGAEVTMKVKGFACEKCAARTMLSLGALDDVIHLEANHESGEVRVWTKSKAPDVAALRARVADLGFQCTDAQTDAPGAGL